MAVKIKIPRVNIRALGLRNLALIAIGAVCLIALAIGGSVFGYVYYKYQHIVDLRLQKPLFEQTAKIYAAPREVRVGQKLSARSVAQQLRDAGYSDETGKYRSPMGTFSLDDLSISIHPGPESYHSQQGATVSFSKGMVQKIAGDGGQEVVAYELEPQLITGLSEGQYRTKRRLVTYDEMPANLVNAVTSIEDRRFFEHGGVDYHSMIGWVWHDLRGDRRYTGGGSTITMQLAKEFFLTPERTFRRKFIQIVLAFQLEHRFTKQQIFQMYANEIPLGQVGSFAINGFGQAAESYFGKDVHDLDVAESALLAGMIQSPSYRNPYRHPERAVLRRNVVLDAMVESGKLTREQADRAKAERLRLTPANIDAGEAPYFVDLVRDRLVQRLGDTDYNRAGLRIYTSLDPDLQREATDAVNEGMKLVDAQVEKLHARRVKAGDKTPITYPQVALVALNPHTGQVLALVGGRSYGASQLDHAVAHRPTGSIFKPFVYAAAYNTSLSGTVLNQPANDTPADAALVQTAASAEPAPPDPGKQSGVFSAVTMLNNQLTTFEDGYAPGNFHSVKYSGEVTARTALQFSLNNATVELAQMVGYNNVAALARDAGIKSARGTPSIALGSYDATPLDMAGAYTVFANGGVKIDPWLLASIRSAGGDVLNDYTPQSKPILDPRVAYLTLSLMENVMNAGTAAGVRARGFTAPAAGKTGTSHDAWFAGFTSNLLCVVWVGNDDYTDLKLEGAHAAGPIWADFMKHAVQLPQYSDTKDFTPPPGISIVRLDKVTNLIANESCPNDYSAAFLDGTAPLDTCDHSNGDQRNIFQKLFGIGKQPTVNNTAVSPAVAPAQPPPQPATPSATAANADASVQQPKKKKGFFGKLFGAIKGDDGNKQENQPPPSNQ
ncbi:MAG TPA: transglycosylase domain-containing protein [Acidobacteriaceae bacterium]|nr:transglycosylase domain-containing protein [Acidobacteriaceae bacterium]